MRVDRRLFVTPLVFPVPVGNGGETLSVSDHLVLNLDMSKLGPETGEEASQALHSGQLSLVERRGGVLSGRIINEVSNPFSEDANMRSIPVKKVENGSVSISCKNDIVCIAIRGVGSIKGPNSLIQFGEAISLKNFFMFVMDDASGLSDRLLKAFELIEAVRIGAARLSVPDVTDGLRERRILRDPTGDSGVKAFAGEYRGQTDGNWNMVSDPVVSGSFFLGGEVVNYLRFGGLNVDVGEGSESIGNLVRDVGTGGGQSLMLHAQRDIVTVNSRGENVAGMIGRVVGMNGLVNLLQLMFGD
jgi:hypothetical protein